MHFQLYLLFNDYVHTKQTFNGAYCEYMLEYFGIKLSDALLF